MVVASGESTALLGAVAALLLAVVVVATLILVFGTVRRRRIVSDASAALKSLASENEAAREAVASRPAIRHGFHRIANSKASLDRFDLDAFMRIGLLENEASSCIRDRRAARRDSPFRYVFEASRRFDQ